MRIDFTKSIDFEFLQFFLQIIYAIFGFNRIGIIIEGVDIDLFVLDIGSLLLKFI